MEPQSEPRYVSIGDVARSVGVDYDAVYSFIRRHNRTHPNATIKRFTVPTRGNLQHISAADAAMLRAIFSNPEEHAEEINDE